MNRGGSSEPTVYDLAEEAADPDLVAAALQAAQHLSYWLDDPDRPAARPALSSDISADLVIVGGGFTGLWTALRAKERDPHRHVVVVDGHRIGWAASGRNGGFCETTLTHGHANGLRHAPEELDVLERLGRQNIEDLLSTVERFGIDCDAVRVGSIGVAVEPHQVAWAAEAEHPLPDADAVRALVNSPLFLAGELEPDTVLLNPARLVWGLAQACEQLGVEIYEHTVVRSLQSDHGTTVLTTDEARITAQQVALATNAFPALLRRTHWQTVPVYDYTIVTAPLNDAQVQALGWTQRQGLSDLSNRFHYWRLTPDNRILYGGYDAIYHYGRSVSVAHDINDEVFARLYAHLTAVHPELDGIKITHAWGGAIDTCSRFFAFYTQAHGGRVVQAIGFTGLGVGASRFAADVMLDLLAGEETERTRLESVRHQPLPFGPDPVAWGGIWATERALTAADHRQGRRGPWLRLLDAIGLGFDS